MVKTFPRFLLALAALVLAVGALMHASAFNKILSAISASDLAPFAANSLKVLWLGDSVSCIFLAAVFGLIAAKPAAATKWVIVLLALVPTATAFLIYTFIGSFIGGHILLAAGVAALIGGLQYPRTHLIVAVGSQ
jgi:hypothetical protein